MKLANEMEPANELKLANKELTNELKLANESHSSFESLGSLAQ